MGIRGGVETQLSLRKGVVVTDLWRLLLRKENEPHGDPLCVGSWMPPSEKTEKQLSIIWVVEHYRLATSV